MNSAQELNVVRALINGVHWGQVLLQDKQKTNAPLFSHAGVELITVQSRATAFALLLSALKTTPKWPGTELRPEIRSAVDLLCAAPCPTDAGLPFNVIYSELSRFLGPARSTTALVLANLYQLNMEEHRDGDALQDLFKAYINAGYPVDLQQCKLPSSDSALKGLSERCAAACAPSPFKTDAAAWFLTFNRIEMWGEKNTGRRDAIVIARELLTNPEIEPLIPKLRVLPHKRVAFIGYSMMMSINWSSHGSWNDIASEVMRAINPRYDYAGFQMGGIPATQALQALLPRALEYKPTDAYLLMRVEDEENAAAFEAIIRSLQGIGSTVHVVDDVRPFLEPLPQQEIAFRTRAAARTRAQLVEFVQLGRNQPDYRAWECLDKIHMKTPGHIFYAKELLKRYAHGK
jgi:hypothetical protein